VAFVGTVVVRAPFLTRPMRDECLPERSSSRDNSVSFLICVYPQITT
jgi:hypothetical protein